MDTELVRWVVVVCIVLIGLGVGGIARTLDSIDKKLDKVVEGLGTIEGDVSAIETYTDPDRHILT